MELTGKEHELINIAWKTKRYKDSIIMFKRLLRQHYREKGITRRMYNWILLKIKKSKFKELDKPMKIFHESLFEEARFRITKKRWIWELYVSVENNDRKTRLKKMRDKRMEFLSTPKYIKRLYLCDRFDKNFIKKIINEMKLKQIKTYEKYYDLFTNIFSEMDKRMVVYTINYIFDEDYIFGTDINGLVNLRDEDYGYNYGKLKRDFGFDTWFLDDEIGIEIPDSDGEVHGYKDIEKLRIFLHGYGYYKMGVFNLFKDKWRFEP
jgi:hypothetical protein